MAKAQMVEDDPFLADLEEEVTESAKRTAPKVHKAVKAKAKAAAEGANGLDPDTEVVEVPAKKVKKAAAKAVVKAAPKAKAAVKAAPKAKVKTEKVALEKGPSKGHKGEKVDSTERLIFLADESQTDSPAGAPHKFIAEFCRKAGKKGALAGDIRAAMLADFQPPRGGMLNDSYVGGYIAGAKRRGLIASCDQ